MKTGKKRIWSAPFFTHFRAHYCPECCARLTLEKMSKVVNSGSAEAKQFEFDLGDTSMAGDVEFVYDEFHCESCGFRILPTALRQWERKQRAIRACSHKGIGNHGEQYDSNKQNIQLLVTSKDSAKALNP